MCKRIEGLEQEGNADIVLKFLEKLRDIKIENLEEYMYICRLFIFLLHFFS